MTEPLEPTQFGPPPGLDPADCAREPIHIPGAIQPHGALLAARADDLLVTHASANLESILGRSPASVLGRKLGEVIGAFECRRIGDGHRMSGPGGRPLRLNAHRSGNHLIVDIKPEPAGAAEPPIKLVQAVLEAFNRATTQADLCARAVEGVRDITCFDRVMLYRFFPDGHGEVTAESHAAHLAPYLGTHYPTTDIPAQARAQLLNQRVGAVADSSYVPVPLLSDPALDDGGPLDLTHSALRSVSPIHREYMRNMGTAASLTVALVCDETLWGVLICHHETPRIAGPDLRAALQMIGQVMSLLLDSLGLADVYTQRLNRAATLQNLVRCLTMPLPVGDALAATERDLLHLVNATGAVIRVAGTLFRLGETPPPAVVEHMLAVLEPLVRRAAADGAAPTPLGEVLAIDDLTLRHPELAEAATAGSGVLLLPLMPATNDVILWFRPELSRIVTWAGDPNAHANLDPLTGRLTPRGSFAAWRQTEHGKSAPWTIADRALAEDLRTAVSAEVAHRAKADLAWLGHYQELSEKLGLKVEAGGRALLAEVRQRQKAEDTLQQARKMEAIGQLTGGVAHDFNNVLAAVLSNLELAQAGTAEPAIRHYLQSAQAAAERGASLTGRLLAFARKQPLQREAYDLSRMADAIRDLIIPAMAPGVAVKLALAADIWPVIADATQFEMALLNIALNASQAMPRGGTLVIVTQNVAAGSPALPSDLAAGDYVCISLHDSGIGMSAEIVARAFEPFYTTKDIGKGTGLGLSQVYGFSKQLGGTATIASLPGAGTSVGLWLPRAAGDTAQVSVPRQPTVVPRPASPRHRLLVVDDDPLVLEATEETLRALGYDVVAALSARLGLEILSNGTPTDLLITDFSMPEMNGVEFIRSARRDHPDLPCLLVTGYADIRKLADAVSGGVPILQKPFRMKDLAASLDRIWAA